VLAARKRRSTKGVTGKRSSGKRERLNTKNARFYAKRTSRGRFKEMDEVGRSQRADRRRKKGDAEGALRLR